MTRKKRLMVLASLCIVIVMAVLAVNRPPRAALSEDHARIVMIGIRGMSWSRTLAGLKSGRMPELCQVANAVSAWGDIVTDPASPDIGILGSVLTGMWIERHGVTSTVSREGFNGSSANRTAFWDVLAQHGHEISVVGFPLWYPLPWTGSRVVPDWATIRIQFHMYSEGHRLTKTEGVESPVIDAGQVPKEYVALVTGENTIGPNAELAIRNALACDLTILNIALAESGSSDDRHVFAYFEGLSILEESLAAISIEELAENDRDGLIDGYYTWIDLLLAAMTTHDNGRTLFVLFSENGNREEPITYRPYLPESSKSAAFGVLLAWGYPVQNGRFPQTTSAADLAPTLLYITGVPIPKYLDGVVHKGLIDERFWQQHHAVFGL